MSGAALVFALAATVGADEVIEHQPLECVPAGRYTRVEATAMAAGAARAELQFRTGPTAEWYSVSMAGDRGRFTGMLPRPVAPLARFEYRILVTGKDLVIGATTAIPVRVGDDAAPCETADAATDASAPIVVRVPAGAPVMPPVPVGFSPAGVVAFEPPARKSRRMAIIGAGVAAAAGIAAATAGGDAQLAEMDNPEFTFFGAQPGTGALLTPRTALSISVLVTGQASAAVTFHWRLQLFAPASTCRVSMEGDVVAAVSTVPVRLSSDLVVTGNCGSSTDLPTAFLTITVRGETVHAESLDLRYTLVQ